MKHYKSGFGRCARVRRRRVTRSTRRTGSRVSERARRRRALLFDRALGPIAARLAHSPSAAARSGRPADRDPSCSSRSGGLRALSKAAPAPPADATLRSRLCLMNSAMAMRLVFPLANGGPLRAGPDDTRASFKARGGTRPIISPRTPPLWGPRSAPLPCLPQSRGASGGRSDDPQART